MINDFLTSADRLFDSYTWPLKLIYIDKDYMPGSRAEMVGTEYEED